uniref:Uncharacterized protein n=1 Tax=viral metagenome TaxID=1070528 RepID=A0A6C0EL28_9ZZZZ
MINVLKIQKNKPLEEQTPFITILDKFNETCALPKPIANVIYQPKGFLSSESPDKDEIGEIPKKALERYFLTGSENPYSKIDNYIFFSKGGFLITSFNAETLINHPNLESYDNMKYNTLYSGYYDISINKKPDINLPMVWIELICIHPEHRKTGFVKRLLNALEIKIKEVYSVNSNINFVILGLDVAGTQNNWKNKDLKDYYSKLEFNFADDGFYVYTGGGQIGYKEIDM